ncbi:MBL fold metallo-hydrolase [Kordiimonas lipolytica]|uniref:beta-lactamase n=1 Tax=Kordiimonas lipolytica TaxID=1662421 RepID=A0ABV8U9N9_9PROT|nr:MBL fold metallo-hydrolase [Kordiimonas lipolytica]
MIRLAATALLAMSASLSASAADLHPSALHRYVSNHIAWNTNSYWIEGEDGVALIDAQLLPSDARRLAAQIKASGKSLSGVIVTHPHSDHFGGLPVLKDLFGDFPIYATQGTADGFAPTLKQMLESYKMPNAFGEALDERLVMPTTIVKDGETVTIAGIDFEIHDLGAGEAADNISAYQKDLNIVFAGDTFYPYTHYYLGEGHIDGALSHLEFLKSTFSGDTHVLPGHNDASRIANADLQIAYINKLVAVIKDARAADGALDANGRLTPEARTAAVNKLMQDFAHYDDFAYGSKTILTWNSYGVGAWLKAKGH